MINERAFLEAFEEMLANVSGNRVELSYFDIALIFPAHESSVTDIEEMSIDIRSLTQCADKNGWEIESFPSSTGGSIRKRMPIVLVRKRG